MFTNNTPREHTVHLQQHLVQRPLRSIGQHALQSPIQTQYAFSIRNTITTATAAPCTNGGCVTVCVLEQPVFVSTPIAAETLIIAYFSSTPQRTEGAEQ